MQLAGEGVYIERGVVLLSHCERTTLVLLFGLIQSAISIVADETLTEHFSQWHINKNSLQFEVLNLLIIKNYESLNT